MIATIANSVSLDSTSQWAIGLGLILLFVIGSEFGDGPVADVFGSILQVGVVIAAIFAIVVIR